MVIEKNIVLQGIMSALTKPYDQHISSIMPHVSGFNYSVLNAWELYSISASSHWINRSLSFSKSDPNMQKNILYFLNLIEITINASVLLATSQSPI